MMAPHWLDEVFKAPDHIVPALTANDRFKQAVAKAKAASQEAEEFFKQNPKAVGGSPAQQARVAFLEAMNLD